MSRQQKTFAFYGTTLLLDVAVLALILGFASGWWVQKTDASLTASVFAAALKKDPAVVSGVPTDLSIPSLGMSLPVQPGHYLPDGNWTLDDVHTFFALPSEPVNDSMGTTLIYGHNTRAVFKNLEKLTPGAELIITTGNSLKFTYEYSFVSVVKPEDVTVFNSTNSPNVTLQTCSGAWDEVRSMHTFTFKKVEKL